MRDYLIVLGREPELSAAELAAVARRFGLPLQLQILSDSVCLIKGELSLQMMEALAGTIKIAEVLGETEPSKNAVVDFLTKITPVNNRCEFGLSWYGDKPPRWLMAAGLELKNKLKQQASHVRFVTARTPTLSSVVVKKNKLLPPAGFEFLLYKQAGKLIVARTIWVQDFESWSERDFGRPERDAKVGMLPPKLARLMINLAEATEGAGILDPFCGSGTVLQEAAMLGYRHLVGVDADSSGISRTRANFNWLKQYKPQLPEPALFVSDINKLPTSLNNSTFEAIVTEPYLGPALRGRESKQRLEQIHRELTEFYRVALKVLVNVLKENGRLVMVWPVIRVGTANLVLPLLVELKQIGLMQINMLASDVPAAWRNNRGTLWYSRPDAKVIREIVVLKKTRLG